MALRRHPLSLLATSWPWRSLAYVATTPVVAVLWASTCWPLLVLAGVPLGHVERWRLRWVDRRRAEDPHERSGSPGLRGWIRLRVNERVTWTELLHGVLLVPLSLLSFVLVCVVLLVPVMIFVSSGALLAIRVLGIDSAAVTAVPDLPNTSNESLLSHLGLAVLGLLILVLGMYLVTLVAEGQRHLTRSLVSEPVTPFAEKLDDLARSRARLTSSFDDERRRIERDLHDGAQQQLTALVLTLGTLRYQYDRGDDIAPLIDQARTTAQRAVEELRDIVHGIYPAALREHDLADALHDLASRAELAGLGATTRIDLPQDLPADVEVGLYFAANELFTNVAKHSGAGTVQLSAQQLFDDRVVLTVHDDGRGGAHLGGSGLVGVVDRIETLGGQVTIESPVGGPTHITLEVPCASS
ncbi:sensor domain-containing protein [Promicromonospora sp. NPDC057488]|uniref:sensor histidine kinase n=1 Tax=Promicromonospora sp. NPDC057488 TaxID=3346147 RepID=UPI00366F0157